MDKRSIEFIGLKEHLESTKDKHNGHGYDKFVELMSLDVKVPTTEIARLYRVDRRIVMKWAVIYEKELAGL